MANYKELLKATLPATAKQYRLQHSLTQEKMAELLHVSPRAYTDLESGKFCFSTQSLMFLISLLSDNERASLLDNFVIQAAVLDSSNQTA